MDMEELERMGIDMEGRVRRLMTGIDRNGRERIWTGKADGYVQGRTGKKGY